MEQCRGKQDNVAVEAWSCVVAAWRRAEAVGMDDWSIGEGRDDQP